MPYQINLKRLYITVGIVSWLLLLGNTLILARDAAAGNPASTSAFFNNILTVLFILSVFLYQRIYVQGLKGIDFLGYLWKLFTRAGIAAYVAIVLYIGYQSYLAYFSDPNNFLLHLLYQLIFAFFVYFLAKAMYIWQHMVLFHKTKTLHKQWIWLEFMLFGTLLLTLLNMHYMNFLFLPLLGLFAVYILFVSINLKWVAYLSYIKKWRSLLLLVAILISLLIFARLFFMFDLHNSGQLQINYIFNPFLLLTSFFVFIYALASLLVALFSLPTSSVFEQKREDLMNIQRLSQSIQQGQDENQVFTILFDSAIKAAQADGAVFEVVDEADETELTHVLNVEEPQFMSLKELLRDFNISNIDYINNNLNNNSGFRTLNLPFKSLLMLPLKSQKRTFGILYLLKDIEQGFDRETVNIIRTFTNQTILTIENLRLLDESLQNERYKEELKIASAVQDSLIPKKFPSDSWFEISTYAQAAKEVGGDFYDFLQLSESRIAIIIGDVSGKGISAAFHMAQMKGIFHALMQLNFEPDKFMVLANQALSRCLERSSFITSAIYIIDYKLQGVAFARAGHCHTLYYNSMTEETFYFKTDGLGLGIIRDNSYARHIHKLHYDYNPNDVMVIYTDGIIEARNDNQDEYGQDKLLNILSETYHLEAEDIKDAIIGDVINFSEEGHLHDDQTLLVIKFKNVQPKFQM